MSVKLDLKSWSEQIKCAQIYDKCIENDITMLELLDFENDDLNDLAKDFGLKTIQKSRFIKGIKKLKLQNKQKTQPKTTNTSTKTSSKTTSPKNTVFNFFLYNCKKYIKKFLEKNFIKKKIFLKKKKKNCFYSTSK